MAMIAYLHVVRRERFFAHVAMSSSVKFFSLVSREIHHGYING